MEAGKLKETIDIYSKVITVNAYGEETEEWSKTYTCRAQLIHVGGSKSVQNSEVIYTNNKTFHVRLHTPITEHSKIKWNGSFYGITNIEPNRERRFLIIQASLIND